MRFRVAGREVVVDRSANQHRFAGLHERAAQSDGIVRMVLGLVFGVMSVAFLIIGLIGVYSFIWTGVVRPVALIIGIPGLLGCTVGVWLLCHGFWKTVTSRGDG